MILVTGGTGLLGAHLLYDLVKKRETVRATYRNEKAIEVTKKTFSYYTKDNTIFESIQWIKTDVLDVPALEDAFDGVTHVYHCAAMVSFDSNDFNQMMKINVEGTANVVNLCLENNIKKLCYVSSTAAIGKTPNKAVFDENEEWIQDEKTSGYAITKHLSEQEVWRGTQEGLDVVIVNPSVILGPGDWGKSSTSIFNTVQKGLKFYTEGENAFIDVRDVSKAMIYLMKSDIVNERFLLISENAPFRTIFNKIAKGIGKKPATIKAGKLLLKAAWFLSWIKSLVTGNKQEVTKENVISATSVQRFSNQKILSVYEWNPVSLSTSIDHACSCFLADHS